MFEVDPELIGRYEAAVYRVWDEDELITFRIDKPNPDLDRLLDTHDTRMAAFITAHNPGSKVLSPADNDLAHEQLLDELRNSGLCWQAGVGVDAKGEWKPETSVMVFGIDRRISTALAGQFRQNAYVWIQRGEPPRLVWTGPSRSSS
ncbi:MAG: DUF3293 domain-containing protein [Gammaproteobacteria bacterium]|nr:DUF3293 domain-containing protein [Gammaproteobacteria bacterium]